MVKDSKMLLGSIQESYHNLQESYHKLWLRKILIDIYTTYENYKVDATEGKNSIGVKLNMNHVGESVHILCIN